MKRKKNHCFKTIIRITVIQTCTGITQTKPLSSTYIESIRRRQSRAEMGKRKHAAAWNLYEGVLVEQLEDVVLVVELGHVDGRLPVQVLQRPAQTTTQDSETASFRSMAGTNSVTSATTHTAAPFSSRSATQSLRPYPAA
jgi:hypothetical protein